MTMADETYEQKVNRRQGWALPFNIDAWKRSDVTRG